MNDLKDSLVKIEGILSKFNNNTSDITTLNLKFDIIKDDVYRLLKTVYGDGIVEPLLTRIKLLETAILELQDEVDVLNQKEEKARELERQKYQKIIITVIGGLFTIGASLVAFIFEYIK